MALQKIQGSKLYSKITLTVAQACTCCGKVNQEINDEAVLFRGLVYFNCQCGSTLVERETGFTGAFVCEN